MGLFCGEEGAQFAIDTTLVSLLHQDGSASNRMHTIYGAVLEKARFRKKWTYTELAGKGGRARLVVVAAEVGGPRSGETAQFLQGLTKARAQSVSWILQERVEDGSAVGVASWFERVRSRHLCWSVDDSRARESEFPSVNEVFRDARSA